MKSRRRGKKSKKEELCVRKELEVVDQLVTAFNEHV